MINPIAERWDFSFDNVSNSFEKANKRKMAKDTIFSTDILSDQNQVKELRKILNADQVRKADQYTIDQEPISSIALMERASKAFISAIRNSELKKKRILIVCGVGNNGGDGLAITRLLRAKGLNVKALLVMFKKSLTPDCDANLKRLDNVDLIESGDSIPDLSAFDLIIDAIFGSGLTRQPEGFVAELIHTINESGKEIYSIDVPSGLHCDSIANSTSIVKADRVISFQRPKMCFFYPENGLYIKSWEVADIGLDEGFIQNQNSDHYILDHQISRLVKDRKRYSHKGNYGHTLLIAGEYGKMGAAVLAARACLKSGTGLLTTYVPKCGYEIIQRTVPEAMCLTDNSNETLSSTPDTTKYSSIGIGPGIGTKPKTVKMIGNLLKECDKQMVLDADALNILSENRELLKLLPENSVLTPHIKEFDRLTGKSKNSIERFEKQAAFSRTHRCIVVLKDAHTCISSTDGKLYFNTSGNPGMATGGSGDVLTGIIAGLLAQQYEPLTAALIAVYYHGLAGDKAAELNGMNALTASDIVEQLSIEN